MMLSLSAIPELPMFAWLALALLAYLLVTGVLYALAAQVRNERERHDLLVQAKQQRLSSRRKGQRLAGGTEEATGGRAEASTSASP